eukprot:CAMPEP_0202734174 /NCGR_PEP_ID=MMETSP1385-20130828/188543_1 /ASSEMBLY_ACC=CAM_ASM_000861 /TAXON_ID=933848 /ORGANISM="Elphidium margaritaceum" /LENGTH=104 /DNA_ID=CAMNT_0049400521 /DNA_START=405 /DNA_END=719 /DNA_ORIENTATION=-
MVAARSLSVASTSGGECGDVVVVSKLDMPELELSPSQARSTSANSKAMDMETVLPVQMTCADGAATVDEAENVELETMWVVEDRLQIVDDACAVNDDREDSTRM